MPSSKNDTHGKKRRNFPEDTIQLGQYYKDTGSCDSESLSSHCSRPEDGIAQVTRLRPWTVQPGHRPSTGHRRTKDGGQPKTSSSDDFKTVDGHRRYSGQSRKGSLSARRESQSTRRESRQVWGESIDVRGGDSDVCDRRASHDYGGNVDFCGDYGYRSSSVDHSGNGVDCHDGAGDHDDGEEFLDLDVERDGLVSSDHELDVSSQPWAVTELQSDFSDLDLLTASAIFEGGSLDVSTEVRIVEEDEEEQDEEAAEDEGKDACEHGMERWFKGPAYDSDDYDTDLEDDFPPEPTPPPDASGVYEYQFQCERLGVIPVTFLVDNIGDSSLRMKYRYLGGQGTKPLAAALKKNTVCEEIDLSDNYLEGSGAVALAGMLKDNMFIVTLNISNNAIRSKGCAAFAEMLDSNTTLKTLYLKGNELVDCDAKRLAEALRNNMSLNCLDLSYNSFGEVGGIYLAAGLTANYGLADLDLSWNSISMKGALAMGKALTKNASLEVLDLSWNGLQNSGGIAIGQALKVNKSLRVLDLSNNNLSAEAARAIAQGIAKNQSVETIMMGNNPIGHAGVEAMLKGIAVNNRLKLVGVEGCLDLTTESDNSIQQKITEIQSSRDILIMYSANRPVHCKVPGVVCHANGWHTCHSEFYLLIFATVHGKINRAILAVFERFVVENAERMEDLFNQMDKDHSGDITLEEFKSGLRDFGLRLTSKQLDMLLEELDSDRSGTIEFSELMKGSQMVLQEKEKIVRAARDAQRFHDRQLGAT